jgi:hypothetical protein
MATQCAGVGRGRADGAVKPAAIRTLAYSLSEWPTGSEGGVRRSTAQWTGAEYANGPGSSTRRLPSGLVVNPEASVNWRSPSPSGRMAKSW